MSKHKAEQLRNIVLIGHGAAGKTTLADRILFVTGRSPRPGSVDDGTSQLDTDDEARQRHFSISSALAHCEYHGLRLNLLDTPGYPDFIGQVVSPICAAETALVVVNADAGVEANTRRTFELAGQAGLARMIVVNKVDHENVDLAALVDSLRAEFGPVCNPLNLPDGVGASFSGVVSLLQPDQSERRAVEGFDLTAAGTSLMDNLVEADDELLERYLEGQALSSGEVLRGISKSVAAGRLVPILFASAKTGAGVRELLDAVADFALAPGELVRHGAAANGADVSVETDAGAPLVAQVFKTRIDPYVSKMSFIRVFSGKLSKDATVRDSRTGRGVRLSQLLDVQGDRFEPIDEAHAGDLVAVAKIDDFQVGDTLTEGNSNGSSVLLPPPRFPRPMIGLAVEPKSRADQAKISGALHKIEEEDPTFHVMRDPQTHEMVIQGMSELHLQIVRERLQMRDHVEVVTHQPRIPYRETAIDSATGSYRHKKQSGGAGQFAEVHLRLDPLPDGIEPDEYFTRERFEGLRSYEYDRDLNFAFLDCVSGGSVPNQFIPAVHKGVREQMERGVLAGYQARGIAVSLFFGKDHPVDSNEAAFRMAGGHCFHEIFLKARPTLLEPIMALQISIPADRLGDVSGDLTARRGRIEGIVSAGGSMCTVHALAPIAELATYARALSGLTGGRGSYLMEFSRYEIAPAVDQQRVIAAHARAKGA